MRADHVASSLRARPASLEALAKKIAEDYGWSAAMDIAKRAMVKYSTPQKRGETSNMLTVDQVNT